MAGYYYKPIRSKAAPWPRNSSSSSRFPPCREIAIYSLAIAAAGSHRVKGKSGNRSNS